MANDLVVTKPATRIVRRVFAKTTQDLPGPRDTLIPRGTEIKILAQYACTIEGWNPEFGTIFTPRVEDVEVRDVEETF